MENIQDKMQEIHAKYGTSEMANYKIEQFVEQTLLDFSVFIQSNVRHLNFTSEELLKEYLNQSPQKNDN